MKPTHTTILFALALAVALTNGFLAAAQSNAVPGDTDYSTFSQFITQRNIFDPNRYPHEVYHHTTQHIRRTSAPEVTLVGTMAYQKGMFAFFSGNDWSLRKILTTSNSIVGYTVTDVTPAGVKIQGADKKEVAMNIGDQLRESNNGWVLTAQGDAAAGSGTAGSATTSNDNSNSGAPADSTTAAPSASLGNNDVLKRLMQLREQENK
jgi:hypothetical protein